MITYENAMMDLNFPGSIGYQEKRRIAELLKKMHDDNVDLTVGTCDLRSQPANEPLTLEQLRGMEQRGEGIYVTHTNGTPIFRGKQYTAAVLDRIVAFGAMGYHLQAIYGRGLTLAEDDYGKTWLAYRRKPEAANEK